MHRNNNDIERLKQPAYKRVDKLQIAKAQKHVLTNGVPLYVINMGEHGFCKIDVLFEAGNYYQESPLIASVTNSMLVEGTRNYSSKDIASQIDYLGAGLQQSTDQDFASLSLFSLNKYLPQTLDIFSEVLQMPTFPAAELDIFLNKRKQQFLIDCNKVQYMARMAFGEKLFGPQHPYGKPFTASHFENITPEQLLAFHAKNYTSSNCVVIATGSVDDLQIRQIENCIGLEYFGSNNRVRNNISFSDVEPNEYIVPKDDAVQSAIRMGKRTINKYHPDFLSLQVLNTILGGYFGSRLMKNIREDKGYTYGIGSMLVSLQQTGYWVIASEVGADVCKAAITEIRNEIERLQNEPVPEYELTLAKNFMLGDLLRSFDGPFANAESLRAMLEYSYNYDYFEKAMAITNDITSADLLALAQKYLSVNDMVEVVAGRKE